MRSTLSASRTSSVPKTPIAFRAAPLVALSSGLLAFALVAGAGTAAAATLPEPSRFLGIEIGADRTLADYRQIASYLHALADASPRVQLEVLGKTTLGEDMLMAIISSEQNLARLDRVREIAHRLADPRGMTEAELEPLIAEGPAVLLVTCNIHATEIGSSQMAMEWAYALASADDAETRTRLDQVVLLLVPSLNPDGQIIVTDWYRQQLGTRYEGGRLPWLYHHYAGHDNNRDWFMLTQKEARAMTRAVVGEWFPQVWLDEHQMGSTGPRIFVPPFTEPVSSRIHPLIWREVNLIGSNMALRLEQAGKSGVIYGFSYDAYWPGGTMNTAWWKNISGLLTEVASARVATPVEIDPGELRGGRKGLVEYGPQTNFPNPWPGGTWRLRDIMDYERIASDALLETVAHRRADVLRDQVARARHSIASFGPEDAWRIPVQQHDPASAWRLATLLADHGVDVQRGDGSTGAGDDYWVPLAQPYGPFAQELLETQRYPEVKLQAGDQIVQPYDVSAWSLPLMMGVDAERARLPRGLVPLGSGSFDLPLDGKAFALEPSGPENARLVNAGLKSGGSVRIAREAVRAGARELAPGTVVLDGKAAKAAVAAAVPGQHWLALDAAPAGLDTLQAPRVGLYKPWSASMDEGWTRYLLDTYGFDSKSLDNEAIRAGDLRSRFDAIILPDVDKSVITSGRPRSPEGEADYREELPEPYRGGLEKEGAQALVDFVEKGGTLVALAEATEYVIEQFNIPVRNGLSRARGGDFASAGALLRVDVEAPHPVTWGLPPSLAIFLDESLVLETTPPGPEVERAVLARYPPDRRDILLSGWVKGEEHLAGRAAAVAVRYGQGKLVLLAFRAQHRAQTPASFPFLFNSLYWARLE